MGRNRASRGEGIYIPVADKLKKIIEFGPKSPQDLIAEAREAGKWPPPKTPPES